MYWLHLTEFLIISLTVYKQNGDGFPKHFNFRIIFLYEGLKRKNWQFRQTCPGPWEERCLAEKWD